MPAAWSTVPVVWDLYGHTGDACTGVVVFTTNQIVTVDGDTYVPDPITALVTNGVMAEVSLPSTDDPDIEPTGWTWTVTALTTPAGPEPFNILAPAGGGTINLAELLLAESPEPLTAVAVGDQFIAARIADGDSATRDELEALLFTLDANDWPIYAYGNSYANDGNTGSGPTPTWFTAGLHYLTRAAEALNAGTVTSYAINGTRLVNMVDALRSEAAIGTVGTNVNPLAGSYWPGTSDRQGIVVLDTLFNDIAHYPTMVSPVSPTLITTANTYYKDGCSGMLRLALAYATAESRIEQDAGTFTGTWISTAAASAPSSGGSLATASQVGAAVEFSVTPPQYGPLAGTVFVAINKLSPDVGVGEPATIEVQVDGGTATPYDPSPWEQYLGTSGAAVQAIGDAITVTVPVDGEAHSVKLTHAGSAGQRMIVDCVLIPSEEPNPTAVMGRERPPNVDYYDADEVANWKANAALLLPALRSVVAEFPNAIYVPSTVTANGLVSTDGIHPNDRGQAQQANDLVVALEAIRARLRSRALALATDYALL